MYMIVFYVPDSHAEVVKKAMFAAGAGKIGSYDQCAWQVAGTGQFRALETSCPYIGQAGGGVEQVTEYRVEMVCEQNIVKAVVKALKSEHPYETPAYSVFKAEDL